MNKRKLARIVLVMVGGLLTLMTVGWVNGRSQANQTDSNGVFSLIAPSFAGTAYADGEPNALLNDFPDDEVGIAAYINSGQTIDLDDVEDIYRTIETHTSEYILGSVGVTDYNEDHDVHVYINTNGWIMAYYRETEPVGKILDWRHYDGGTSIPTKLDQVLDDASAAAGLPSLASTYYHFAWPNANRLMLIAERGGGIASHTFDVTIPGTFTYYERSWSVAVTANNSCESATYLLDGDTIATVCGNSSLWEYEQGKFTSSELSVNDLHTVTIATNHLDAGEYGFGGLALIYLEQ
jgi:hypothetical protein